MRHRHLGETAHQQQRNCGRENVAENDAGPGDAYCQRASQKQSCADRAADGNHAQLPLVELAG